MTIMSFGNNFRPANDWGQQRGFGAGNGYQNYDRGNYNSANYQTARPDYKRVVKHSGAKAGNGKNNAPFISGWNKSRAGFLTVIGCPCLDPTHSSKGKEIKAGWDRWVVTCEFKASNSVFTEKKKLSAFLNTTTRKLYIPDLGMVVSPSSPNGGYFGKCSKPRR